MATTAEEPMDVYFAVFNQHVNNAKRKARRDFRAKFGPDAWRKHMTPFVRKGIMSIFNETPTRYTKFYAETVQKYVNGE